MVYKRRLANDLKLILSELANFNEIQSLVVESTYNWYWLVDGLHDSNFKVKLANPNAIQQYKGLKHTNDKTDARWLAELSRLDILPEGHIFPKETRGIRDLLRKRGQLVENKTMHLLSMQTIIERNTSLRFTSNQIHKLTEEDLNKCLADEDDAASHNGLEPRNR